MIDIHIKHEPGYLLLAFCVGWLGSLTALQTLRVLRHEVSARARVLYLLSAGIVLGVIGVWALHFIAILALNLTLSDDSQRKLDNAFDPLATIISILPTVTLSMSSLWFLSRSSRATVHHEHGRVRVRAQALKPLLLRCAVTGIVLAAGTLGTHHVAMNAWAFQGVVSKSWNGAFVSGSVLTSVIGYTCVMFGFAIWHLGRTKISTRALLFWSSLLTLTTMATHMLSQLGLHLAVSSEQPKMDEEESMRGLFSRPVLASVLTMLAVISTAIAMGVNFHRSQSLWLKSELMQHDVRVKSQLFANLGHELRTPLYAISATTDLMRKHEADGTATAAQRRDDSITIHDAAQLLVTLVNQILLYSKSEAGALTCERVPLHPRALVQRSVRLLQSMCQLNATKIAVHTESEVPEAIWGDPTHFQQILLNLLSNAVKFSPPGTTIHVRVFMASTATSTPNLCITVQDQGRGISNAQMQLLFRPFVQLDGSDTRVHGGTGLGLVICKNLATALGGSVDFVPQIDASETGAMFRVTLPVCEVDEESMALLPTPNQSLVATVLHPRDYAARISSDEPDSALQEEPSNTGLLLLPDHSPVPSSVITLHQEEDDTLLPKWPEESPLGSNAIELSVMVAIRGDEMTGEAGSSASSMLPLRILAVDDMPINRKILWRQLQSIGHDCDLAENGQIAVEMCENTRYDVVLMDLQMPILGGVEATQQILARAQFCSRRPPVVIGISASVGEREITTCLAAGMRGVLRKPITPTQLSRQLKDAGYDT
jgi:signal transduction histidine kinase